MTISAGAWLWLGAVGLICLLLLMAYGYLLLHRRRREWWQAIDGWLTRRLPIAWRAGKRRVLATGRRRLAVMIVAAAFTATAYLFAKITEAWHEREELHQVDQAVYHALADTLRPELQAVVVAVTHLGSYQAALIASLILLAVFYRQRAKAEAVTLLFAVWLGKALVWALKLAFARPRPEDSLIQAAGDAFPSGHAFAGVTLYGFVVYLVWGWTHSAAWRIVASAVLSALALAIGASRILLRVHWFSDVAGGFVLGLGWLVASLLSLRLLR